MPELPEVEITCRGIAPHITGQQVKRVIVRQRKLRWPVPGRLEQELTGQTILSVERRAKYLLLRTEAGTVIIHLGMSGNLRIVDKTIQAEKHDHVDIEFTDIVLRLHDPRRFGCVLWTRRDPGQHKLLRDLGPEPLDEDLNADYLHHRSRKRKQSVKTFLMDNHIVVGVGNIYASEALFMSGIRPAIAAGRISKIRYERLVTAVKKVLTASILQGGTTLKDFLNSNGEPGYFDLKLKVYGRVGESCVQCGHPIQMIKLGQRSTYYCRFCQQ